MQRILKSGLQAFACLALLATLNTSALAAHADDTWTWTTPARGNAPERTSTLVLKTEGDKLTGTVSAMGRQNQVNEVKITDGTIKGDDISFKVTRERQGNSFTQKYTGKVSGDTIKGKVTFTNQDGEERSTDWEAKRKTDDKKPEEKK